MYNVPIDEDRLHPLVVEVLKDWFEGADTLDTQEAILKVIEYGSVYEEYKEWLESTGWQE